MECFRIWIGSESGSQNILDAMDRQIGVEVVHRAVRILKQYGIQVGIFIMLGYAGETEMDLEATAELLKRAQPDEYMTTLSYPIKGTPYFEKVQNSIAPPKSWSLSTDRDYKINNRPPKKYYEYANRWIRGEVQKQKAWTQKNMMQWIKGQSHSLLGKAGMFLTKYYSPYAN
jgi:radical SAM superfamily enzyme YgiQ (UPF0313 family)